MKRSFLVALTALLTACTGELTELLVVVDSDLAVPSELDSVRVTTESMSAAGALTNVSPLPRTVGIVHRGGESYGPLVITVVGTQGGTEVVRAQVTTSFIRGQTLVLPVHLSRRCIAAPSECVREVDPATLSPWNGMVPGTDGGLGMDGGAGSDGGSCTPSAERCNDADDDCDGAVDEDFDLSSDPQNCGACMMACMLPSATESCSAGACTIASCEPGFGDCNDDASDGCEVDVRSSPAHCGGCGNACALEHATASCTDGACAIESCDAGFDDCDGDPSNGCETPLDTLTDCGACGVSCSVTGGTASCESGTCAIGVCEDPSTGDCNRDPSDGCEATLDTLTDCGGCGVACDLPNASESCASGTCEIVECSGDWADCDGDPSNGCEVDTGSDEDHCGACDNACSRRDRCRSGVCR